MCVVHACEPACELPADVTGFSMSFHLSDFLSGHFDPELQTALKDIEAFPAHLAHCMLSGPPRRYVSVRAPAMKRKYAQSVRHLQRQDFHPAAVRLQSRYQRAAGGSTMSSRQDGTDLPNPSPGCA